jgi:hypothetical protein
VSLVFFFDVFVQLMCKGDGAISLQLSLAFPVGINLGILCGAVVTNHFSWLVNCEYIWCRSSL